MRILSGGAWQLWRAKYLLCMAAAKMAEAAKIAAAEEASSSG